ncbi:putative protease precursor signal peptide protein [Fulvimarina pelagi HTCC2506]|uniref:Putative protease signal peptide protein n=1 Tax=Fulvimarina pelagi HTCC2506 TaxID=314231 RepID=Q0G0R4_9HYPH|nr:Do family serine endopeptidase [Fulvimarina pelagi]EAU40925.1 putative protease precursor signal peptide protein [Fulvimarina pelagi HTCC2506]
MISLLPRLLLTTALIVSLAGGSARAQATGDYGGMSQSQPADGGVGAPEPQLDAIPEIPETGEQEGSPVEPADEGPAVTPESGEPEAEQGSEPSAEAEENAEEAPTSDPESEAEAAVPALPAPPVEEDETTTGREDEAASEATVTPPASRQGPESVSELAESLLDAVVNISTAQRVERPGGGIPPLEAPEGSPLQDFFDDLLRGDGNPSGRRVQSLGSGFVIDPSGVVITNNHVIQDADEITVNFADGSQLEAELLGRDPKTDLAVLKVQSDEPLVSVAFGDSETIKIGDWVMAIGNPFGLGGSVSLGIVSARGRNINAGPYDNFIQTDAAINRGNSGGPLFDMNGNVVGINTAIISPTGGSIGIGFSIPANLAVNVVNQLREFGETRRGWLGIRLSAVTDDIASGLGIGEARGAVVVGTIDGGPSQDVLKAGDVITAFDGKTVESSRDLPRIVAETPVGKDVEVEILRKTSREADAEPMTVTVTLGRLEDGERLMAEGPNGEEEEADGDTSDDEAVEGEAQTGATDPVLGLTLGAIDDDTRSEFNLPEDAEGVLITAVAAGSNAAEKGIEAGMLIQEIAQESVSSVSDVEEKLAELRSEGRRNALMLVAEQDGDLRFVVLPLD